MSDSALKLKFVLKVPFYFPACLLESEFRARLVWPLENAFSESQMSQNLKNVKKRQKLQLPFFQCPSLFPIFDVFRKTSTEGGGVISNPKISFNECSKQSSFWNLGDPESPPVLTPPSNSPAAADKAGPGGGQTQSRSGHAQVKFSATQFL